MVPAAMQGIQVCKTPASTHAPTEMLPALHVMQAQNNWLVSGQGTATCHPFRPFWIRDISDENAGQSRNACIGCSVYHSVGNLVGYHSVGNLVGLSTVLL